MEKLFGRAYESIGSTGSDFIIKTKGQVKIQWGNKFIDIVKNGKINVDASVIKSVETKSDINTSNGIYKVNEDNSIYVVVDGEIINLKGEVDGTYVAFVGKQDATPEQKYNALTNIGLIYESEEEAVSAGLTRGLVYIESAHKLYTVIDSTLVEYSFDLLNPYPKQLVVEKKTQTSDGAIVVRGYDKINSFAVQDTYLYQDGDSSVLEGKEITLIAGDSKVIEATNSSLTMNKSSMFKEDVLSNMVKSIGGSDSYGFRLYMSGGESTLEVDNVIWRNKPIDESGYTYPVRWLQKESVIKNLEEIEAPEGDDSDSKWKIITLQPNSYEVGNLLCTYVTVSYVDSEENDITENIQLALNIEDMEDSALITTIRVVSGSTEASEVFELSIPNYLSGKRLFFVASGNPITRIVNNNIDLLNVNSLDEEQNINNIKTRIGSIQDLNFTKEGFNIGTLAEGNIGIYSDNLVTVGAKQINSSIYAPIFKASPNGEFPKYDSGFNIPVDDDSKTVVTSEWVNDKTDKRLEEYVRKDQLISLIESYIQPVDGTRSNPVTLVAGTIRRATNSTTDWYFIGGKKARITDVQVTVKDGLMTITLVPASGSTINVLAVSAVIGDTGEFNGDFSITSRGGRGAGAHWCNAIPDPNTLGVIRVREYHQANNNNDSWGTANWNYSNGPISLSFAAFGYIVG